MTTSPLRERVSAEERRVREDLAVAYRAVADFGWDDFIFTHLSARVPGPDSHFLLNPYELAFDEITASSLIKVDVEGNAVQETPYSTNPAGFVIHSAVHMARSDAHCVMHLHTIAGQAVSAQKEGLLPLCQTAMLASGCGIGYHDYEGVATNPEERERLVGDLGERPAMILRNHGTLACGPSVGQTFLTMYMLERACAVQVSALAAGVTPNQPSLESIRTTEEQARVALPLAGDRLFWPAMLRRVRRRHPDVVD